MGVPSEELRSIVKAARDRQRMRYGGNYTNAIVSIKLFEEMVRFSPTQLTRIETVSSEEKLSTWFSLKILRLSRTISDARGKDTVSDTAVDEALNWKVQASRFHGSLMR
ncbi:magnesium chelatase subunit ChlI family protein [Planococcus glaciei]|uniref:magnesium chelatase subunit ChlI family protein n=1 Tax=Planococcus glaciei TaxID=459472 RepID=UPI001FCFA262|nr:hypothetical protein [Planococcus glaciei]